jgi:uncharacterized membrane protein
MSNNLPLLDEIIRWLLIGMRPSAAGQAVTVGSSNELGADRAVLTSIANYTGPNPTVIQGINTNVFPRITYADGPLAGPEGLSRALAPSGLRNVFIPSPAQGNNPNFNRWFTGPPFPQDNVAPDGNPYPGNPLVGPNVDYLPYLFQGQLRQARTVRGVDWSGNVAVTSATGRFSLSDINIFADIGVASTATNAAANISNSYYFPEGSLVGLLMSAAAPNPARGWTAPVNFLPLLTQLRIWRDFLRGLTAERIFSADVPGIDLVNRNSIAGAGPFVYFVPDAWDTNNDGIIVIDIPDDGTDFSVNNSDWVIEGTGNKLIVFRIRGRSNMLVSNSSIMLGEQFTNTIGPRRTGVLFVKVFPEEEFTSPSGSSDSVFNLSNAVMHGISMWDLNTIGDAITDTPYGGNATRVQQSSYTNILHSNTQGCGQFISGFVNMQNVRWIHCEIMTPFIPEPRLNVEKFVSPDGGTTFFDADTPPGPSIPQGTDPVFRYVVTNTGNVPLQNVTLTDSVLGTITVPTTTLAPGESFTLDLTGTWAEGQQFNIATATGVFDGITVVDEDPAYYVGVIPSQPSINVEKFVSPDGGATFFDADTPPGPNIPQGTDPVFRYVVTNTGNVPLQNVTLVDSVLGTITIPTTTLAPGESFTVDVTGTWAQGQQFNLATATGEFEGITVTDADPAYYVGLIPAQPSINVEKFVSPDGGATFFDADTPPGPSIPQGTNPVFRYVVTNTGNVPLQNVTLTDSVLGPITIPTTTLAPGESFTVDLTGSWAQGQQFNLATATGEFEGITVTDEDPAYYVGVIPAQPSINVEKFVSPDGGATFFDADTPPGPSIPQGTNPVFRYVVTNTGNVPLQNVTLVDSVLGLITVPTTTLAPGESFTVDVTGTWAQGQQFNLATATGVYEGITVTDADPAYYVGLIPAQPSIDVEKFVSPDGGATFFDADTPQGPSIPQGTNPVFRYVVTNTGNVPLQNVTLTDSVLGTITIPTTTLAPGESFTVDVTGTWAQGQQLNLATATGEFEGITVTDEDPAYYVGVIPAQPSIDVEKFVSPDGGATFFDADTPPGASISQGTNPVFRYVVTNTGNVPLQNVTLTDSVLGTITIPTTTLAPGESFTVDVTGTWAQGQQFNLATATGEFEGITVTDADPAYYVGVIPAQPSINVEKFVSPDGGATFFDADTSPGPNIPQGTDPVFRYVVTNTGNVPLQNVTLTDSVLGPITIPTTTLAPGESFTVDVTGTWAQGQQFNLATATGEFEGITVTDEDPAYYVGIIQAQPSINVEKFVSPDGGATFFDADTPPGPNIPQGTDPVFRYVVTNTGNVPLQNVTLVDSVLGPITIPTTTLAPGESFTVDVTGTWAQGQQFNLATATGVYEGINVTDADPAYYVGVVPAQPSINVEKFVSPDGGTTFFDADTPPGPSIPQGTNPVFRYVVTNTGNVPLQNVTLTDSVLGTITIPTTTLAPGESFTVDVTGTWAQGQQLNLAKATGVYEGITVTDMDPAYYVGIIVAKPSVRLDKLVSVDGGKTFILASTAPGPTLPPGMTAIFKYIVTNTGNVPLTNVTVRDNVLGFIGSIAILEPGESEVFIAS